MAERNPKLNCYTFGRFGGRALNEVLGLVYGAPGAPKGKDNGNYRHGGETGEAVALRRSASELLKRIRDNGITA